MTTDTRQPLLAPEKHDRDISGMTYVYPVVSRRAQGVSVGINLNPNNACNWRCIYCQVPGLTRGSAPETDLERLETELRAMLHDILHGDFMTAHVPEGARQLQDIAFSGNGESTSSAQFGPAIARVENVLSEFGLLGQLPVRLITNGSQMDKPEVLAAIEHLARIHGEIWFKVDAATREGIARINDVHLQPQGVLQRLRSCAQRCPTWVQTCVFALDGVPPAENEIATYLELLLGAKDVIAGVHLYGLARPSMQREAPRLSRLPEAWLQQLAQRIAALGLEVRVSP